MNKINREMIRRNWKLLLVGWAATTVAIIAWVTIGNYRGEGWVGILGWVLIAVFLGGVIVALKALRGWSRLRTVLIAGTLIVPPAFCFLAFIAIICEGLFSPSTAWYCFLMDLG